MNERRNIARVAALLALLGGASGCDGRKPSMRTVDAKAGTEVLKEMAEPCASRKEITFIVASDTHFGAGAEVDARNLAAIRAMNSMPGTPWPEAVGGKIGDPCGVLVTGDLTEDGKPDEWGKFVAAFGLRGNDAALSFPVFETLGNHDKHDGPFVRERITERHGGVVYAFDWGGVHFVSLGEAPDDDDLRFLEQDLDRAGRGTGVVLYFHFPLMGAYSTNQWFGDGDYRDKLSKLLAGRRVLGIFHGHYHAAGLYRWNGIDVYRTGSPKHRWHTFSIVEITDVSMKAASFDYDKKSWVWWHSKPLDGDAPEVRWGDPELPP